MKKNAPFTIQLDHINAICEAALASETREPGERYLQSRFRRPVAEIHECGESVELSDSQDTSEIQFS